MNHCSFKNFPLILLSNQYEIAYSERILIFHVQNEKEEAKNNVFFIFNEIFFLLHFLVNINLNSMLHFS